MRPLLASVLLFMSSITTLVHADLLVEGSATLKVKPARPPIALPFSLHDVKVLSGPFKQGQDAAAEYLLSLEADRLLSWFRKEAGLKPKAPNYGGWENHEIAGHSLGHYLTACSLAWASTDDRRFLDRVNYMVDELAACQKANGDGYLAAIPGGKQAFADIKAGKIRSGGFDLNGLWVPNYTQHKVFAGLRDAYRLCGSKKALTVAKALADWYGQVHAGLNEEQMQRILACEHGGLNETFADLYADTGDARYLKLARRFHHKAILDPLAAGEDILPGKHANTQVPKLVGLATLYDLAGRASDRAAADFFWERVVRHHSYVTGGHCDGEHFGPPGRLNDRLSANTTETCNINNMLKLSEHVFGWRPEAEVADFYERALLNQIRSAQHPDGRVIYNLSLMPGHHKHYQRKYDGFTCCVGTGMENHVKYAQGIYFHGDYYRGRDDLWVNLFIPSEVNWKSRGLTLKQETRWPLGDSATLTISTSRPQILNLRIRHPHWARQLVVKINGKTFSSDTKPSSYCQIKRTWKNGDKVEVTFPMHLRTECMPDNPNRIAIFYGATLLAADLGEVNNPEANRPGFVPKLIVENRPISQWVKPVDAARHIFKTDGIGKPRDVTLVPFHSLHDQRYTVYLDKLTPTEWAAHEAEIRAEEKRRKALEARTVDFFQPGEMQQERDHKVKGENTGPGEYRSVKFRHAWNGGWFSFVMKVDPDKPNELNLTYWGSETGQRTFDVLVNGRKLATQKLLNNKPGKFWIQSHPLPADLTKGKTRVLIKLQAHPGNYAGGLFGARMVRAEKPAGDAEEKASTDREEAASVIGEDATAPPPALPGPNADPHIACFDGTYYIYPTTDGIEGWGSSSFSCWSSRDLVQWKNEGVILDFKKDLAWANIRAWAPCIATKNGKYYFYYSAEQQIGVAVSGKPAGPFKDPLGKPLIPRGAFACQVIDPMVFVDDDGSAYLYFGQGNCNVVKLNDNMISFDPERVKRITPEGYNEGAFMIKRKGIYYLMWSSHDTRDPRYCVNYAKGPSPMGPFTPAANNPILKRKGIIKAAGHHSVVQVPGQEKWFIAYHRFQIPGGNGYNRETCIAPMHFDAAGDIRPVNVFQPVQAIKR